MSKKVLVIEDNERLGTIIKEVLENKCGINAEDITWVLTYEEGEVQIRKEQYDVVLLDHSMPRKLGAPTLGIGYGLIPLIKQCLPHAKVIGTSSHTATHLRDSGFEVPEYIVAKVLTYLEKELPGMLA